LAGALGGATLTTVEVEWGVTGAEYLAGRCDVVVVCDVLSFSTSVSVAVTRGVTVYPHAWRDASAVERAATLDAVLAGPRGSGVSLSPPSLQGLAAGSRLVLPSPNGATCCLAAARGGAVVVAGCLRNAPAVASWLGRNGGRVGVVAAGEHWHHEGLRPAYEDWVGAGAIVAELPAGWSMSPDAEAAALAARSRRALREVMSGLELIEQGFPDDVLTAEEYGADTAVPVLREGAFSPAQ
jgi:2-phosphosulfolactate phosphatase